MAIEEIELDATIPDSATAVSVGPKGCKLKLDIPAGEKEAFFRLMEVGFDRRLRVSIEVLQQDVPESDPAQPGLLDGEEQGDAWEEPYPGAGEETEDQAAVREMHGTDDTPYEGYEASEDGPGDASEGSDDVLEQDGDPELDEREMLSNPGPGEGDES